MSDCYVLSSDSSQKLQTADAESFVGGMPKIPPGESIPCCELCGAEQSFFFQIAIPKDSYWSGLSLAVFACTSCANENYLIPEMLSGQLLGADIPEGFLTSYQRNFKFLIFETKSAIIYENYRERIRFTQINLVEAESPTHDTTKLGGIANWLLGDESPKSYNNRIEMFFLLQILPEFQFEIIDDAPRGLPKSSSLKYYRLFNGNKIFLFGTRDKSELLVYAITQV